MTEDKPNKLEKICSGVTYGGIALSVVSLAKFATDVYYNITAGSHDIDERAIYTFGAAGVISLGAALTGALSYQRRTIGRK